MKRLLVPGIAVLLLLSACQKGELSTTPGGPVAKEDNVVHSTSRSFSEYNYFYYRDPTTGGYSCPDPKIDCARYFPKPDLSFKLLDDAIANGKVQDFFTTPGWETQYPFFTDNPNVTEGLRNGSYTLVRRANLNGEVFYITISASEDPENFQTTVFTYMIPHK